MRRWISAAAALLSAAAFAAAADDPLRSPGCQRALAALQAQEDAASQAARGQDASTAALRREAARTCLGATADMAPPPPRQLMPPITVPSVSTTTPMLPRPSPAGPPLPAPGAAPLTVVGCDITGCWASDGSRLRRVGADLLGPRGLCSVQAAVLRCP